MTRPIVVITGSRSLTDEEAVGTAFASLLERLGDLLDQSCTFMHGGAVGVDTIVGDLVFDSIGREPRNPAPHHLEVIRPDYEAHGKQAPLIRNCRMINRATQAPGSAVIAIWDGRSRGTAHAISYAARAKLPIFIEVMHP
jgi:hypothetical protein